MRDTVHETIATAAHCKLHALHKSWAQHHRLFYHPKRSREIALAFGGMICSTTMSQRHSHSFAIANVHVMLL